MMIIDMKDDDILCCAVENGPLEIVKYLVEHGADIHIYNEIKHFKSSIRSYQNQIRIELARIDEIAEE